VDGIVTVTKFMLRILVFCDMFDSDLKKYLQMTNWLLPLSNKSKTTHLLLIL